MAWFGAWEPTYSKTHTLRAQLGYSSALGKPCLLTSGTSGLINPRFTSRVSPCITTFPVKQHKRDISKSLLCMKEPIL